MDGVERVYNDNPLYHVTITLMQTSASNDVLTMMLNTDRLTGNRGKFPMMIRDTKGLQAFSLMPLGLLIILAQFIAME